MKYHLFISFLLVIASGQINAQKAEKCLYLAKYSYQTVNTKGTEIKDRLILSIGQKASLLQSLDKFERDSLSRIRVKNAIQESGTSSGIKLKVLPLKGYQTKIYNQYASSLFKNYRAFGNEYYWETPKINFHWKILNGELSILGFKCKKAQAFHPVLKKNIVVWYTGDIPFATGPGMLQGLPGLILKMQSEDNKDSYELYALTTPDKNSDWSKISLPESAKKTTQEKFNSMLDAAKKNPKQFFNIPSDPVMNTGDNFFKN
ncbi:MULTISPECIES: GLPGLI family protein [Chitinophagaceae]